MNWSKVSPTTQILIVINVVLMFFMYYTSSSMVLTREVLIFFGAVGVNTNFYSTFVLMRKSYEQYSDTGKNLQKPIFWILKINNNSTVSLR